MEQAIDLELALHQREVGQFTVEMRVISPGSDTDIRLGQEKAIHAKFDLASLKKKAGSPGEYGLELTKALFADADLVKEFSKARTSAQTAKVPLRVRLVIGPSAMELNTLFWEALRDPEDEKAVLFSGEQVLLSRYISSGDWRPVTLRARSDLRALVAIANPSDLKEYELEPVKAEEELQRAREALKDIPVTALPASDGEHCTLEKILDCLRGGYDILYIVAHGTFKDQEPWLWLENETGTVNRVSGYDLAKGMSGLENQPRLVVLASCQSAGAGDGEALQSLGPSLARGGIPAVIAMQGSISMPTVEKFMPVFFKELQKDGQIDRAVSAARSHVKDQDDFWMPVLFMRLRSGRIWYVPGFGAEAAAEFKKWHAIVSAIDEGTSTPILGGGLHEPLYGSNRELALALAQSSRFPLAQASSEALPQVTQFLSINQSISTLRSDLKKQIRNRIQSRLGPQLPEALKAANADVLELISHAGKLMRDANPAEQHRVLAEQKLPIYITTNYDNLMFDALKDANVDPQMVICPWNEDSRVPSIYDTEPTYTPSPARPLVYHLFGHFSVPESLVLTEDDHFEFLIGATKNKDLIPARVKRVLTDSALMFLGFQLDDWSFRIFFRYIMDLQGGSRRSNYAHIAVQVDPDEIRNINPGGARDYLEAYFRSGAIDVYWGQSQDFLQALGRQRSAAQKEN